MNLIAFDSFSRDAIHPPLENAAHASGYQLDKSRLDICPAAKREDLPCFTPSVLQLPQLTLAVAPDDTAVEVVAGDLRCSSLIVPFSSAHLYVNLHAIWFPVGVAEKHVVGPGMVLLEMDMGRLLRTARAMSLQDIDHESLESCLGDSGPVSMSANGVDFTKIFRALFLLIHAHQWDTTTLTAIHLDELIYRQVVQLLRSSKAQHSLGRQERSFKCQLMDELCNKLLARLHLPLTLADIEALSGISARGLQYAFQERFGCSPMAWVREQRLLVARERLLRGKCSVMEVAVSCGFGSSSLFTRYYQARFSETPSNTLKKQR